MKYKGYSIDSEYGHYLITGPTGQWREDTVEEAKKTIDEEVNNE